MTRGAPAKPPRPSQRATALPIDVPQRCPRYWNRRLRRRDLASWRLPGRFGQRLEFACDGVKGPVEGEVGDGLPAGLAAGVVVPTGEHLVRGDGGGVLGVLVVVVPLDDRRQDVVAAAGDEQQRGPVG